MRDFGGVSRRQEDASSINLVVKRVQTSRSSGLQLTPRLVFGAVYYLHVDTDTHTHGSGGEVDFHRNNPDLSRVLTSNTACLHHALCVKAADVGVYVTAEECSLTGYYKWNGSSPTPS